MAGRSRHTHRGKHVLHRDDVGGGVALHGGTRHRVVQLMRHEVHGRRHLCLRGRPSAPNACSLQTFKRMRCTAFARLATPQATHTHTHTHTRSEQLLRTPSFTAASAPRCWLKLSAISPPSRGALLNGDQSLASTGPLLILGLCRLAAEVHPRGSSLLLQIREAWRRERHEPEKPAQHRRARARCAPGPNL